MGRAGSKARDGGRKTLAMPLAPTKMPANAIPPWHPVLGAREDKTHLAGNFVITAPLITPKESLFLLSDPAYGGIPNRGWGFSVPRVTLEYLFMSSMLTS